MAVVEDLIATAEREYAEAINKADTDHEDNLRQIKEVHDTNKEMIADRHVEKVLGKFMN